MPDRQTSIEQLRENYHMLAPSIQTPFLIRQNERYEQSPQGNIGTGVLFGGDQYRFVNVVLQNGKQYIEVFHEGSIFDQEKKAPSKDTLVAILFPGESCDFCMEDDTEPRRHNVVYLPGKTISHEQASFSSYVNADGSLTGQLTDNKSTNGTGIQKGSIVRDVEQIKVESAEQRLRQATLQNNHFMNLLERLNVSPEINLTHEFSLMFTKGSNFAIDGIFERSEIPRAYLIAKRANGQEIMVQLTAKGKFLGWEKSGLRYERLKKEQFLEMRSSIDGGKSSTVPRTEIANKIQRGNKFRLVHPDGSVEDVVVEDGIVTRESDFSTVHFSSNNRNVAIEDVYQYIEDFQSGLFIGTMEEYFKTHTTKNDKFLDDARRVLNKLIP